jgi:hypothetical protein
MKINVTPRASVDAATTQFYKSVAQQVNALSEGRIAAFYTSSTAAPTTGTWAQGDFVKNSAPVEAGVALSKYVLSGWICVASGTPGTWLPQRILTGN